MEFKFMQVGNSLYGKAHDLDPELEASVKKNPVFVTDIAGEKKSFESPELEALLSNKVNGNVNYKV
jgi:hypothetical protein